MPDKSHLKGLLTMTTIIDELEKLGSINVKRNSELNSILPITTDQKGIENFQQYVDKIKKSDGLGYEIFKTHTTSEVGIGWIDLILFRYTSN